MKKRLKVLLIKPYNLSDHIQPSLGLGYLASNIRDICDVRILDCIKERIQGKQLLSRLKSFTPDIVGVQVYTYDLKEVKDDLKAVKEFNSKIITLAGGPHPSAIPHETFLYMGDILDFIFVSEAEKGLPELIKALSEESSETIKKLRSEKLKNIPGLCWINNSRFVSNKPLLNDNLDSLGFPAWDLIHPETYPEAQHGAFFKNFPIAPIITSRGCPFNCTFCAGHIVSGKKIRQRSVNNVIEEIKTLTENYGIKEIHIIDDNFAMYKEYVMEFCKRLSKEKINISWATPNGIRVDRLDKEMLTAMKESGYYLASVGIEFGSDRMLKRVKKGLTKKKIIEGINLIKDAGLDIAGFFIIGYIGETKEEIKETIKFSCELPLLRANFFLFLPLPGTESYLELKDRLELDKVDWEHFYFTRPTYNYLKISNKELKNLQREAFLRFYLRPKIFIKNLLQIKTLRQLRFLIKRAYRWIIAY